MKYLIPLFDCYMFNGECVSLKANVKYKLFESEKSCLIVSNNSNYIFDISNKCEQILEVEFMKDTFYFLLPKNENIVSLNKVKYFSGELKITLSNKLIVSYNEEVLCEKEVNNLCYSHSEIFNDFCLLFFEGQRNFIVIVKGKELCFASYYDECNKTDNEIYFMCKKIDSLNHGEVAHIADNIFDKYLVYLDNEEMCLKDEFISMVFLDCVLAKNFKYCNALLSESLRIENEKQIEEFFPEFTTFFAISAREFILINKNTLAGIFEFSILDSKINNIIHH